MAQTYAQVVKQIADLQAKAEKLKRAEVGEVIAKIKAAIAVYDITAEDLYGTVTRANRKGTPRKGTPAKAKSATKYADGAGNAWTGRGPKPRWLREALASGKRIEELLVGGEQKGEVAQTIVSSEATPAVKKTPDKRASKKQTVRAPEPAMAVTASQVRYTDGIRSWTGRGPKPRWLKEAVAGGKTLDELRVQ